jgi:flagellar basal body-associated protein FliL
MFGLSRRSGKNLVMMAVTVALVIAALGAGMVMGPKLTHRAGKGEATAEKHGDKGGDSKSEKADTSGKPEKGEKAEKADKSDTDEPAGEKAVVSLGEFLVNLDNGGGEARYLRAEVSLRVAGLPPAAKEGGHGGAKGEGGPLPPGDVALARDRVVTVLSAGVFGQLRSTAGRQSLKQKLLGKLQEALPDYDISEVLFTSFVMQ